MLNTQLIRGGDPVIEPVTLEQVLEHTHIDAGVEDGWVEARIIAGRQFVEDYVKRSIPPQTWVYTLMGVYGNVIALPRPPFAELVSVDWQATPWDGKTAIDIDTIKVMSEGIPAEMYLPSDVSRSGIFRIEYRAGGAGKTPQPFIDAIMLYVAWQYESRSGEKEIPKAFFDLIEPYRLHVGGA